MGKDTFDIPSIYLNSYSLYSSGIIGAFGLALFAGSLPGAVYSFILALVLSHTSHAEEEELRARFGEEYGEYARQVPRLLPCVQVY